jgi:hypothetical protein
MLANINFIGELFKVNMLTPNIMHYCITTLLDEKNAPDEEKIELLCKLLQSIGEKLDTPVRGAPVLLACVCLHALLVVPASLSTGHAPLSLGGTWQVGRGGRGHVSGREEGVPCAGAGG